ncbi:MAG: hypothetical protein ACXIT9_06350 [Nitritalea sp.]
MNRIARYFLAVCLLCFFCMGCGTSDEEKQVQDLEFIPLAGTALPTALLGVPRIQRFGERIIALARTDSDLFSVIDPLTGEILFRYGQVDLHPEHYSFPRFIANSTAENPFFYVYDADQAKRMRYSSFADSLHLEEVEKLPLIGNYQVKALIYQDDDWLLFMPERGALFVSYDKKQQRSHEVPLHPLPKHGLMEKNKWIAYQAVFGVHAEKKIVAVSPYLFGELMLYDFSGQLIRSVTFDSSNHDALEMQAENITRTDLKKMAYDLDVTPDSIFLLLEDATFNEQRAGITKASKILHFDWEGRILGAYQADRHLLSFVYSAAHEHFFASSMEVEDETLISYPISLTPSPSP